MLWNCQCYFSHLPCRYNFTLLQGIGVWSPDVWSLYRHLLDWHTDQRTDNNAPLISVFITYFYIYSPLFSMLITLPTNVSQNIFFYADILPEVIFLKSKTIMCQRRCSSGDLMHFWYAPLSPRALVAKPTLNCKFICLVFAETLVKFCGLPKCESKKVTLFTNVSAILLAK